MIYVSNVILHTLSPPILQFVIWLVFIESLWDSPNSQRFFTATQRILIGSQTEEQEVNEQANQHLLHIYHIAIRLETKFLIGVKVLSLRKWVSAVGETRPRDRDCRCGPGLELLVIRWFASLAVPKLNQGLCSGAHPDQGRVCWNRC